MQLLARMPQQGIFIAENPLHHSRHSLRHAVPVPVRIRHRAWRGILLSGVSVGLGDFRPAVVSGKMDQVKKRAPGSLGLCGPPVGLGGSDRFPVSVQPLVRGACGNRCVERDQGGGC